MRYQSNLRCPDLSPYFKLKDPPLQICGHDMPSDPDFEPECGFWTHDEAAILFNVAKQIGGRWIDVGARFGWTGAHLIEAGCQVTLVDPDQRFRERQSRLESNLDQHFWTSVEQVVAKPFEECILSGEFNGVVIDGCHSEPAPLDDAINAYGHVKDDGVILFHDTWGAPTHRGIRWLMDCGYQCRMYDTPNGVALLWNPELTFTPPEHISDPNVNWALMRKQSGFDYSRCI